MTSQIEIEFKGLPGSGKTRMMKFIKAYLQTGFDVGILDKVDGHTLVVTGFIESLDKERQ